MKIRLYLLVVTVITMFITTGCTTAIRNAGHGNGGNYILPIDGNPPGADVEVPELGFVGVSPTKVTIPRSRKLDGVTILISKDGFEPQKYDLKMRFDAVGGLGLFLDALTFPVWLVTAGAYATDISKTAYKGSSIKEISYALIPVRLKQPAVRTDQGRILSPGEEEFLRRNYRAQPEPVTEPADEPAPAPKKEAPKRPVAPGGTLRVLPY